MMIRLFTLCLLLVSRALPALSHEFWIEPFHYQLDPGDTMEAHFVNGEIFEGVNLGYFDRNSARLQAVQDGALIDLAPRNGDKPAMRIDGVAPGLLVLVHETTPSSLTYRDWAKFAKFAAHKDFPRIGARHDARGLPRDEFVEIYTRHAKALIGVGAAGGADRAFGLDTEIVAQDNPYAPDFDGTMQVEVLYQGAPRADAQLEIFDRAPDGSVEVRLTRTDANGLAEVQTKPGHSYLLDAVTLREAPAGSNAAWETLWAALTFAVPAR